MTSNEFTNWLKGFMEACDYSTLTSKQWDRIKEELERVSDTPGYVRPAVITTGGGTSVSYYTPGTDIAYTTKQQLND